MSETVITHKGMEIGEVERPPQIDIDDYMERMGLLMITNDTVMSENEILQLTHGGKRAGAGRPPQMKDGERHNIYLPREVWEWLIRNGNASQKITQLVQEKLTPAK